MLQGDALTCMAAQHASPSRRDVSAGAWPRRESERLLGDAAAQAGEAALTQGMTYRSGVARGIHSTSSSIASGLMVRALPGRRGGSVASVYTAAMGLLCCRCLVLLLSQRRLKRPCPRAF